VSTATVSRTVNQVATVDAQLAKRVWKAIAELGYYPNRQARALVEGIVGLGNSLGMVTVAEGVENFGQLEMVRGFGCAEAQGYYFSAAVAPGEVERLLNDTLEHARDAA